MSNNYSYVMAAEKDSATASYNRAIRKNGKPRPGTGDTLGNGREYYVRVASDEVIKELSAALRGLLEDIRRVEHEALKGNGTVAVTDLPEWMGLISGHPIIAYCCDLAIPKSSFEEYEDALYDTTPIRAHEITFAWRNRGDEHMCGHNYDSLWWEQNE